MKQLESGFKRTINRNKYQPELKTFQENRYLNYLIDPCSQGVNRLFVLPFENETDRAVHTKYYLPNAETKDYVIIKGRNFFDQPIKHNLKTYFNIRKIATEEVDNYTTGCLLDYNYFKKHYELIAIGLSKQQKLNADPKAIEQINFTGNLEKETSIFLFIVDAKETVLEQLLRFNKISI